MEKQESDLPTKRDHFPVYFFPVSDAFSAKLQKRIFSERK
jgi:hypothetical protein